MECLDNSHQEDNLKASQEDHQVKDTYRWDHRANSNQVWCHQEDNQVWCHQVEYQVWCLKEAHKSIASKATYVIGSTKVHMAVKDQIATTATIQSWCKLASTTAMPQVVRQISAPTVLNKEWDERSKSLRDRKSKTKY